MRKLDRSCTSAPACLSQYQPSLHRWGDLRVNDKQEIRACLEQMQGRRCAYCEGDLDILGEHIEHFRPKGNPLFHAFTFDWTNLYWSCSQDDSCGRFKDNRGRPYDVAALIDPCCDNPDTFFRFRSDGTISVRPGLTPDQQRRATETLRVLSIDAHGGRLRNMRKRAVSGYVKDVDEAVASGFAPAEIRQYLEQELRDAAGLPFLTAIRHVLIEGP